MIVLGEISVLKYLDFKSHIWLVVNDKAPSEVHMYREIYGPDSKKGTIKINFWWVKMGA